MACLAAFLYEEEDKPTITHFVSTTTNKIGRTSRRADSSEREMEGAERKHFVLVHGACHGAWCWYKLIALLTAAGHRATAIDLAASGIHPKKVTEVSTFSDYSEPLMEIMAGLPSDEKVILVGHSFGGISLGLAMDRFPEKISVAALMPDTSNHPLHAMDKHMERAPEPQMDNHVNYDAGPQILFGPNFLAENLYQNSSLEDLTLATTLVRTASFFMEELRSTPPFSKERYGSVTRVYIVCEEDRIIEEDFQRWMIDNNPVKEVKVIKGADHMPMFSKPQQLGNYLLEIAQTHS